MDALASDQHGGGLIQLGVCGAVAGALLNFGDRADESEPARERDAVAAGVAGDAADRGLLDLELDGQAGGVIHGVDDR